ncbi:MAG: DUF4093 domain-containing protein [Clostridiales bacterium]|nr:DUF4093 domain-containing protein [Clostridiales bacterium]
MVRRIRLKEAIVVEGRYDKNTLAQLVDTLILTTEGFQIFRREDQVRLLRRVARERGLIVLTDSDGAGFVIRNHLKGMLPPEQVKHAYIPDLYGKEKRKARPGKEGKLGVEGMTPEVLTAALRRAGATFLEESDAAPSPAGEITTADLYRLGLTGGPQSRARRAALYRALDLPEHLSSGGLLQVLNTFYTLEEVEDAVEGQCVTP